MATKSTKPVKKKTKAKTKIDKKDNFLIVGIGASAGGLEAFKEFFNAMPSDSGIGFVIVQHLDPSRKSMLTDLLSHYTDMPTMEVKDGTAVEPNNIYVIPPNKNLAIFNGKLQLLEQQEERAGRRPIDFFLRTLAADQKTNAVGIIFSGTGTEGTLSLKSIKGNGGLSIVQDPKTAKYNGMPTSAIEAGSADFILPAYKIPEQLIRYSKSRKFTSKLIPSQLAKPKNLMEKIFILIRSKTGCNFNDYKDSTVLRRIEKRMAINEIVKLEEYVKLLQESTEEVNNLFNDLLIGVTSFFRDPKAFEQVAKKVIPQILNNKKDGEKIRVWIPACSTGEEAYTLSILFNEAISKHKLDLSLQIFASDIDENSISFARLGVYPETISADIDSHYLEKYFTAEKGAYTVKKEIRDQIIFAVHNVLKDPPFSKVDMVSCRNLLIYLNKDAQQNVLTIFHYSLLNDGVLFLGNSESLGDSSDLYTTLDRQHKIFLHKNNVTELRPKIGFNPTEQKIMKKKDNTNTFSKYSNDNLVSITERFLLKNYAPACAIIDIKGDALYFSGNIDKFLHLTPGKARLHLVDMVPDELKSEIRTLISMVRTSKKREERKGLKLKSKVKNELVDLVVFPISEFEPEASLLMITFESRINDMKKDNKSKPNKPENPTEIFALEQELESTKEYLRSTINQLETSNEELTSANEELQSANEELQSTNEEMETSKEELQSVNEEMVTVNSELHDKMGELANAYNDMNNLLTCIDIGTIFLDSDLKIRRFTPSVSKIFNLIQSDIGRPIIDMSSNLDYDAITSDSEKVLKTLIPIKKTVQTKNGLWFLMQIIPYRTSENLIDGVVITFVDIANEKNLQQELEDSKNLYDKLLNQSKTVIYTQDKNLKYTELVNPYPQIKNKEIIGKSDADILKDKGEIKIITDMKKSVLKTGKSERKVLSITINKKRSTYDLICRPVYDKLNKIIGISCVSTDITDVGK